MKRMWLFRHPPKEDCSSASSQAVEAGLENPEGWIVAKKMVERFLEYERIDRIYTSPLVRAYQTGVILAQALRLQLFEVEIIQGLFTPHADDWADITSRAVDDSCAALYQAHPAFVMSEGRRMLETIIGLVGEMFDGRQAVCISHGNLVESTVAAAKSWGDSTTFKTNLLAIRDLEEGEGFLIEFDAHNMIVEIIEKRLS